MRRNYMYHKFAVILIAIFVITACESRDTPSKTIRDVPSAGKRSQNETRDDVEISASLKTLTVSMSNNRFTSKTVNRQKLANFDHKLEESIRNSKDGGDSKSLITLVSTKRIYGAGLNTVLDVARKLVAAEMKKKVERDIPEFSKMEIALAAIKDKKFNLAELFLIDLVDSKNKSIRAAAHTAVGIIAAIEDRLPEAVLSWQEALKVEAGYEAALLNLGFVAIKYGDSDTAKSTLGKLSNDWYAQSGLLIAERITGNKSRADSLCERVLAKEKAHKPTLYNCALHELQTNKNYDKAYALAQQAAKINAGSMELENATIKLLSEIEQEKSQVRRKAAADKAAADKAEADKAAAERAAKAEKEKAKKEKQQPKNDNKQSTKANEDSKGQADTEASSNTSDNTKEEVSKP